MIYKQYLVICFTFLLIGALACKKKSNGNPFGSSKIATVSIANGSSISLYRVVYDQYNNVDSIINSNGGYTAFKYFASSYTVTNENNNSFTVSTDANGNIQKIYVADTATLAYNGSEVAEISNWVSQQNYPYYSILQTYFTWQNGNVTGESNTYSSYTFDYDNSKPGQPGDAWRIPQFLQYGRSYIKTSQLPTDMMSAGTWVEKYFYVTDGSGRVTQFIMVTNSNGAGNNDSTFYTYTYYN